MVLRITSAKVTQAPEPGEEQLMPGDGRDRHAEDRSPRAMRDSAVGSTDRHSQKKVAAADVALDLVLQEIVQQARLATMATGAFVGVVRANKIVCLATSGSNAGEFAVYLDRDQRMVSSCLSGGTVQICGDSETSEELEGNACRYLGARSVVMVPVINETASEKDKKLGIFGVFAPQVAAFSDNNVLALQGLSHRIAEAMARVDRFTSASGDAATPVRLDTVRPDTVRSESGKPIPLPARDKRPRSALRSLAAIKVRGPAAWGFGVLAVVLLAGWGLSRVMSPRTMETSAKALAPTVAQPATSQPASIPSDPPVSDQPASSHPSSSDASTHSSQSPAAVPVVKPNPTVARSIKPVTTIPAGHTAVNKVPARPGLNVPELEIENALDDATSESLAPASVRTSKPSAELRTGAAPASAEPVTKTTSMNTGYPPVPGNASAGSPPREAVRITRAPGPSVDAPPSSSDASKNASPANSDPSASPPVMLQEWTALAHVAQRVQPDYPPEAKAQHTQGTVVLDVVVSADGQVESVTPVDGDHPFVEAADKAMRKWRFTPFIRNKQAVRFESHITLNFALP
ncbi:MAG TPA: TonB family protein [Candidatus Sulfotelmatobacter sp.]